jgi:cell division septation protein DedD
MSFRAGLEAEEPRSPRRGGPFVVVVLVLVMAASAAGLWAAWRIIGHHGGGGPVPVIHADENPVKVAPANPDGMAVPDQNISILNDKRSSDSRVEQLLPPPEAPLPRPAPAEPIVTEAPPAAAPAITAAPAVPPSGAATIAPAVAPPVAAAPAATPAATPAPPPRQSATDTGYRLQVGAVRSSDAAQQEWTRLKRVQADILGKLDMRVTRTDLGARGVFYRIEAGPIADGAAAQRACEALKQRKVGCILVRP